MIKAPNYDWRYPHCRTVNAANTAICSSCHHDVTFRSPTFWQQMKYRGVPASRRVLVIVGYGVGIPLLVGGLGFCFRLFFPTDLTGMLWSPGVAATGGAFVRVAYALDPDR
ncbi:MAG: hypothetical protein JNL19_13505 [Burkholderiales bacterium]|nr:hypothetical protein [Burkholderiales bacterium]